MPKLFVILDGSVLDGERPDELPGELVEALEGHSAELDSIKACGGTSAGTGEPFDAVWRHCVRAHYITPGCSHINMIAISQYTRYYVLMM